MVAKSSCNEPKFKEIPFTKLYKFGLVPSSNFTMKPRINFNHFTDSIRAKDVFRLLVRGLFTEI